MLNRSRRARTGLLVFGLAGLAGACQETTPPVAGVYHPTLIGVTPSDFLTAPTSDGTFGNVPCATTDGALRTYVATAFDVEYEPDGSPVTSEDVAKGDAVVTTGSDYDAVDVPTPTCAGDATPGPAPRATVGFALPSSGPTDCHVSVSFSRVTDGHRYRAVVDGYDRSDLVQLSPGTPLLVDPATGERVDPTWKWSCGDECPENAYAYLDRSVGNCVLVLGDPAPPADQPANVLVSLDGLAGTPACGAESGKLDHFSVSYVASGTTTRKSGACGEQIELDGVPARGTLSIAVLAYEAGKPEASWGTSCTAAPIPGLTLPATCAPLSAEGALDVDPGAALAALGYDCNDLEMPQVELRLDLVNPSDPTERPIYVDAKTCTRKVRFSSIVQGTGTVEASLYAGTAELGHATCSGSIVPARAVTAECSVEP